MNLILLDFEDMTGATSATLVGRRAAHIFEVHRACPSQVLKVGLLGGNVGTAVVTKVTQDMVQLEEICLTDPPPEKSGLDFILAIPRPKVLTRALEAMATLGAKRIALVNSARVEKSYFDSPRIHPTAIREALLRGLEQAKDTVLPEVMLEPRFRPFIEDKVGEVFQTSLKLASHPGQQWPSLAGALSDFPPSPLASAVVAIGPEGGFVPFETQLLQQAGFKLFQLGERILRVETALSFIAGQFAAVARASHSQISSPEHLEVADS